MIFLALVMMRPRDFPYSKKLKKLAESLIPKRFDSMVFSPNVISPKETLMMSYGSSTARPKE